MPLFFQKRFDRFPYDLRLRNAFADTFSLEFLDHILGQTSRYCAVCLCVVASLDSRRGFVLRFFSSSILPPPNRSEYICNKNRKIENYADF